MVDEIRDIEKKLTSGKFRHHKLTVANYAYVSMNNTNGVKIL